MRGNRLNIFFSIIMIWILLLSGCSGRHELPVISLWQNQEQNNTEGHDPDENTFRVAIAGPTSAQMASLYYESLTRYLEEHLGTSVQLMPRKTYAEVNDLLRAGTAHLGIVSSYSYLLGKQEFGLEILVTPELNEGETLNSYILVHRDSGINTLEELQNKTFAYTDPNSTLGRLYPLNLLILNSYVPETFFRYHIYTYSSNNAIRAVSNQLVDGAAANNLVFNSLALKEKHITNELKIIHISPPLPLNPIVISPSVCRAGKDKLDEIFLTMHQNERGLAVLAELGYSHYTVPDSSHYDSVCTMIETSVRRDIE